MIRKYKMEGIWNFRDLGGYECRYGVTKPGVLYRSASLEGATPKDVEKLAKLGIRTVIDLRNQESPWTFPSPLLKDPRFHTVELAVNGGGRVAKDEADMVASYIEMLEEPVSAKKVWMELAYCPKPAVIHCMAGKDRTGCFCFVLLLANGVSYEDANADYLLSLPYLRELRDITLQRDPTFPNAVLYPTPLFLEKVYAVFQEKWGDVHSYFRYVGLDEVTISILSNLLGKQEKSCGAVIRYGDLYLVEKMKKGHYSLCKGHVEREDKGEIATAKREAKEETGLTITVEDGDFYPIVYSPRSGHVKRVIFYRASAKTMDAKPQPREVAEILWLPAEEAMERLTHESDKEVLRWAISKK